MVISGTLHEYFHCLIALKHRFNAIVMTRFFLFILWRIHIGSDSTQELRKRFDVGYVT